MNTPVVFNRLAENPCLARAGNCPVPVFVWRECLRSYAVVRFTGGNGRFLAVGWGSCAGVGCRFSDGTHGVFPLQADAMRVSQASIAECQTA